MRKLFILTAACLLSYPVFCQEAVPANTSTLSAPTGTFTSNPQEARFHTEDISRFWEVYDRSAPHFKGNLWQEAYLDKGSAGLRAFIPNRIVSGRLLAKTLRKNNSYYEAIRASSLSIAEQKEQFYAAFQRLKELYPAAVFPDVYFVIGSRNTGGTIFGGGLIIGAERFGQPGPGFEPDIDYAELDDIVAHELIHFQQSYARDNSLLAQCIREGAADFIGELLVGSHPNKEMYAYGNVNEAALRKEFMSRRKSSDWSGWLYYTKDKSRPKDLGYWVGYQICKAYYQQKEDKTQAISDMLNIKDFEVFLEQSKY